MISLSTTKTGTGDCPKINEILHFVMLNLFQLSLNLQDIDRLADMVIGDRFQSYGGQILNLSPITEQAGFPIVGIGASAGGLAAFEALH